ncbi:MAG TPA: hemolysin family protein [Anaerolineae bacterium]|nr:hemolysin family protein [Anaerolineae bacterium]
MLELTIPLLIVLLSSALCSGSEAALFSVSMVKVRQLAESNRGAAAALLKIRERMGRPIATIVILNNVANIVGSIVVGGIAARVLGDTWLGIFSGALTFMVIIFGEIIPKTLGERYAESLALIVARPVLGLTYLMTPIVWAVEKLTSPVTSGRVMTPTTNEAEIRLLANIGRLEGIIEDEESEMIHRVFSLNDVTAGDIMTPRVAMTYLRGHETLSQAKSRIIESTHSRIIITDQNIDDVMGIALKNELLTALIDQEEDSMLMKLTREVLFVPENVRGDKLLQIFRRSKQHLAVVVDEFGGVAGVVTLEDVLETLTGEIVDETDETTDLQAEAKRRNKSLLAKVVSKEPD